MRNPARKVLVTLALCGLGALLVWVAAGRNDPDGDHGVTIALGASGVLLLMFCTILAVQALSAWIGTARLLRGDGVVARWQVSTADWKRFVVFDKARGARDWQQFTNVMSRSWRIDCPPQGTDVIVGRKSILIDGTYLAVPAIYLVQWLRIDGAELDCLEFHLPRSGVRGPVWYPKLRIPVPRHAEAQAILAYQWHRSRVLPEALVLGPRSRSYRVAHRFGLGGGILAAIGAWWASTATQPVDPNDFISMAPWILVAFGGAGVVLWPILAGLAFFLGKKGA